MLIKSSVLLAITAITTGIVLATPPACLLGAVGSQATPSGVKGVCGNATSVENNLSSSCGDNLQAAMSAFSSVCSSAGVTISTSSPLTTSSVSTVSSSASPDGTGAITSSGSASGSSHASSTSSSLNTPSKGSRTGSSPATQTAAAVKKQMGAMGIGIAAVAGLMLTL
ncbi:hypothetical protein BDV97DRAFT_350583 [Delphinella strobiligena]|nr:hypothetical protein BDV97DRAFT_350583 [Delphinella strobiligena]